MKHDMMWAYLIHLSTNMWGDPWSTNRCSGYYGHMHTDETVWRNVIDFLPSQGINTLLIDVGDAICYESHPEIAVKGAWSKDKLKQELDYIRSLGITPLPKLNFSTCHDIWLGIYHRMVSTPQYYQVCADLIKEVCEVFGNPEYFHLGMDEELPEHQAGDVYCVCRQGELWWHDLFFLFDQCEKQGARPWIWSDMCWGNKEEFLRRMPKSTLQSNWWYRAFERNPDGSFTDHRVETYRDLEKAGFDQVPTSSTFYCEHSERETAEMMCRDIAPQRLKGMMSAPWFMTAPATYYALLNDAAHLGEAKRLFESLSEG